MVYPSKCRETIRFLSTKDIYLSHRKECDYVNTNFKRNTCMMHLCMPHDINTTFQIPSISYTKW